MSCPTDALGSSGPKLIRRLVVAAALVAAALAAPVAGAQTSSVQVYFLAGEQVVAVERPGATLRDAVARLLEGPSADEQEKRITTQIPAGVPLLGLDVSGGRATVDVGREFQEGTEAESLSARLAQLVLTATAFAGVTEVEVLIEGGTPLGLFPGYAADRPLTRSDFVTPSEPTPVTPPEPEPEPTPEPEPEPEPAKPDRPPGARVLQQRLAKLGYLPKKAVDGVFGEQTKFAVTAFQKWEGLARDGIAGPQTKAALQTAKRPRPRSNASGRRIEILLDRQLVLVVRRDRVERTIHVSTGKPGYATPPGSYPVFRKEERSWSVPYKVWLPWASYFVGGIAFHEYPEVPVTQASHGCVRVPRYDAEWLYEKRTPMGTRVIVLAAS